MRWLGVFLLLLLSIGACGISLHQKHDADEQAKREKDDAYANTKRMQATIDGLQTRLDEVIRNKKNHPITLTHYEMLNDPMVGLPLGLQIEWQLQLTKDSTFINRQGYAIIPINEDISAITNEERRKFEDDLWSQLITASKPLTLAITYSGGIGGNSLLSKPLSQEDYDKLMDGRAVAYYMQEIRDPESKQVVFSFCHFKKKRNVIEDCFSHNQS